MGLEKAKHLHALIFRLVAIGHCYLLCAEGIPEWLDNPRFDGRYMGRVSQRHASVSLDLWIAEFISRLMALVHIAGFTGERYIRCPLRSASRLGHEVFYL